jgi:hypothetical protein
VTRGSSASNSAEEPPRVSVPSASAVGVVTPRPEGPLRPGSARVTLEEIADQLRELRPASRSRHRRRPGRGRGSGLERVFQALQRLGPIFVKVR